MKKVKKEEPKDNIKLYTTLEGEASAELVERKSVFIGHACPVKTEEEALNFINRIRSEYSDATHNVYAYLLRENNIMRYSDDNEPQGTAGIPVLDVIRKGGFCDAVIVVTRYFGGILLGAGGLVRAYSAAAKAAVDQARIITYEGYTEFNLKCNYNDYQKLAHDFPKYGVIVDDTIFDENVNLKLAIKDRLYDEFTLRIKEITSGRCSFEKSGNRFDYR